MHEKIRLVHVFFYQLLILLGIATANNQVVLRGDKPDEFLEPEYLSCYGFVLLLLEFLVFFVRGNFCSMDGLIGRSPRLLFLQVRFLFNLIVFSDIQLARYLQIDVDLDHRVKIIDIPIFYL